MHFLDPPPFFSNFRYFNRLFLNLLFSYEDLYVDEPLESLKDIKRIPTNLACDYKSYAMQINQCIKQFDDNKKMICRYVVHTIYTRTTQNQYRLSN